MTFFRNPINLIIFVVLILVTANLHGEVKVHIDQANYQPEPVAFFDFATDDKSKNLGNILDQNISFDLNNCGLFNIYNQGALEGLKTTAESLKKETSLDDLYVAFSALILGSVHYNPQNHKYYIYYLARDIYNHSILASYSYVLPDNYSNLDLIYIAHDISNDFYQEMVGEPGYFNSKLAFVSGKNIYISDYNGQNVEKILSSDYYPGTPVFSPYDNKLAYITLENGKSRIFIYDLIHHTNRNLGNFAGLVMSPRFSPDGKYLLFSLSNNGNTNIFRITLASKAIQQITFSHSINIPGNYSPDGTKIVFMSDRVLNRPQIFIMDANGRNVHRITSLASNYYTPRWSPRGDLIGYTMIKGTKFAIGVMRIDGSHSRELSVDNFAQAPYWTPNGRNIIYQFVYNQDKFLHAFYLTGINGSSNLLIRPFLDVKDPSLSHNIVNRQILNEKHKL